MNEFLKTLENNCRLTDRQLAMLLDKDEGDIHEMIEKYEKERVILGYKAIIDWDRTDRESVTALIEVKITPQRDRGFERVAEKICNYPEVESLYLMSGGFDLAVLIEGKTMKEVAYFVAMKLAPIEDVISTATHFVLRKYKDKGVFYGAEPVDERGQYIG